MLDDFVDASSGYQNVVGRFVFINEPCQGMVVGMAVTVATAVATVITTAVAVVIGVGHDWLMDVATGVVGVSCHDVLFVVFEENW